MQELLKGLAEDDMNGHHISFPRVTGCGELLDVPQRKESCGQRGDKRSTLTRRVHRMRDGRVRKCPVKSGKEKGPAFLRKPSSSSEV